MEFKPKAKSTARPIPIPRHAESPTVVPLPPDRALLAQGLQRLPARRPRASVRPHTRSSRPLASAARRISAPCSSVRRWSSRLEPSTCPQRRPNRSSCASRPRRRPSPGSPNSLRTGSRSCVRRQIEGRVTSTREAAQFSALQRQVAQTLVQGFRADRRPAQECHDSYAAHLVALQRHPSSAQVARVVLRLIPQGERPALQRAVDLTRQREQAQAAHDQQALEMLSYRDVEELLLEREVNVTRESIRTWCINFGDLLTQGLRHRESRRGSRWHLDEM